MTDEELQRIERYSKKLRIASGHVLVLTDEERLDLQALLWKWLADNNMLPYEPYTNN